MVGEKDEEGQEKSGFENWSFKVSEFRDFPEVQSWGIWEQSLQD